MAIKERKSTPRHANKIEKKLARKEIIRCVKRYQRGCPDKVRIVARTIIGKSADQATSILKFGLTKGADILKRCLSSAIDNATRAHGVKDADKLYVKTVLVDQGPTMKRIHPVSHGMAKHILKRSCHVTIIVEEKK